MSENNDNSNESSSMSSDSILQSSRLTGGGSVAGTPVLRAGVLRPSVLGPARLSSAIASNSTTNNVALSNEANGGAATTSVGCDSTKDGGRKLKENTKNPFLKDHKGEDEAGGGDDQQDSEQTAKGNDNGESNDERDVLSFLRKNGRERANIFAAAKNSIPLVEKSGFVFGQNVHERVVGENLKSDSGSNADNTESSVSTAGEGLLFSSVIQNAAAAAKSSESCDSTSGKDGNTETKSLTEVAREYEESRAQKRKYEEVETFTGEENEVNIVDLNCKLFAFVNSNWEERGRGSLRLNDSKIVHECSRLVFRTSGNLRLLLNTKVWAGMVVERPSQKSLRLTAMDNTGKIKIFLVMARPAEINHLHNTLGERIDKRQISHPDELLCAEGNSSAENSTEESKNGSVKPTNEEEAAVEAAAAAAEPEHDKSAEPSPKKPILSVEGTSLETEQEDDVSIKQ